MEQELHYGNISRNFADYLDEKNIFTAYRNEFELHPYPNFYQSIEEIGKMQEIQKKAMQSNEWNAIQKFCLEWDEDMIGSFRKALRKMNIPANDEYFEYLYTTSEKLGALIMQLKNSYQRARPYQYAYYGNIKDFHPYDTMSGNNPSYPSGHACQSLFLCGIIANHYPDKQKELLRLSQKIAESRIILGIHFPSDNAFGMKIAKDLMKKKDIRELYFSDDEE